MTDPTIVARKLSALTEHCGRLRERRPSDFQKLRESTLLQDGIALSLLVAVQEAVDIALHITSDEGWGVPASYRESFELLARHAVITGDLASAMANAAGLRNRIAHGYGAVELERIWTELPSGIALLEEFAAAIARYVQGNASA